MRSKARESVESGAVPSCQIAVAYQGEVVLEETYGAPPGSRYVIFSATKPVVASRRVDADQRRQARPGASRRRGHPGVRDERQGRRDARSGAAAHRRFPVRTDGAQALERPRGAAAALRRLEAELASRGPRSSITRLPATGCWPSSSSARPGSDFRRSIRDRVLAPLGLSALAARASSRRTPPTCSRSSSRESRPTPMSWSACSAIRELPSDM